MKQFNGFYRGKVEDNDDPDNMGRLKCRILGLHSQATTKSKNNGIPTTELDWCEQANGLFGGFGTSKAGFSVVPEIDSWVWIFFECGDFHKPVYFASVVGKDDRDTDADKDDVTVLKTKSGHKITISDVSGEEKIEIVDKTGNTLLTSSDGISITDAFGNEVLLKSSGKMSIKTTTADLKDILDDLQAVLLNVVTAGSFLGNLGVPVVYSLVATDLPTMTALSVKISSLLE